MLLCLCACTGGKNESETAQKEKLVIGSDIYAPYFYIDDNGDFTGIDVEIAHEACGRMNIQPVFKKIVWQNKDVYLENGEVDCLWGSFTINGREVLSEMKRLHYTDDIPVIMISVDMSDGNIRRAFDLGVTDYISRPFDSKVVMQRIHNTVRLYSKQQRLTSLIARQHGESINNEHIMTDVLSGLLGRKNGESAQHIRNIRKITEMLLERLILKTDKYGLSWRDCDIISEAAALHDVGKIEIDSAILNKPGKLTPEEREIVKQHTVIGEEILLNGAGDSIKNEPMLETAAQICRRFSFGNVAFMPLRLHGWKKRK